MQNANEQVLITPFFKVIAMPDPVRTKTEGRPCFKDQEFVEIRIAGERNYAPCFPALSMWTRIDGEEVTYAERWPDQYLRFKEGQEQVADGTPLSEVPFLTQAKRAELRACKIYTLEALAALDGKNLKTLGMDGRTLKNQAIAFLESARGSADVTGVIAENAVIKQQLEELKQLLRSNGQQIPAPSSVQTEASGEQSASEFADWDDELLKEHIAEKTGARPRGNPSHQTLVQLAEGLQDVAA